MECKFCNIKHWWESKRCPAFGKTCAKCNMKNHTAEACRHRCFKTRSTENYIASKSEKEGVGELADTEGIVSSSLKLLKPVKKTEFLGKTEGTQQRRML